MFNLRYKTILSLDNRDTCEGFHHFERLLVFVNPKISKKISHLLAGEWNFLPFENLQVLSKEVNQSLPMGLITWNLLRRVSVLDHTRDGVQTSYYSCFLRITVTEIPKYEIGTGRLKWIINSYTTLQAGKVKPQMPGAGFRHHKQGLTTHFGILLLVQFLYELTQLNEKSCSKHQIKCAAISINSTS